MVDLDNKIARYLSQESTASEIEEVENWINENPSEFQKLSALYNEELNFVQID